MYFRAIISLGALVFLLSAVSALSTNLASEYAQAQTVITEIQGPILAPISEQDIKFLRGHVEVPFVYSFQKLGTRYFLYFITPAAPNVTYTLVIENIETMENGQQVTRDFAHNFTTTNETAPYTIQPGLILTQTDFELSLILNRDYNEPITINGPVSKTVTLAPGQNTIGLSIDAFPPGLSELTVGLYRLQVYAVKDAPLIQPTRQTSYVRIFPDRLEERLIIGEVKTYMLEITNIGKDDITSVPISYNMSHYTLTPTTIKKLKTNQTLILNLTLKTNQSFTDTLGITIKNETLLFPITIEQRTKPLISMNTINATTNTTKQGYYCAELNGRFCASTQVCSTQVINALDGSCCTGTCTNPEKTSYAWVGYLLGALVLILLIVVGGRYLKSRSGPKNILTSRLARLEAKP